jgi:hypothetical protein
MTLEEFQPPEQAPVGGIVDENNIGRDAGAE